MFASMCKGHQIVEDWIRTFWVLLQEILPRMRMVEVCNEHPSNRVATASKESHREEERQTIVQKEVAKKVHAEPQASNKGVMLDSAWEQIVVPFHCEQAACIVETKEVDNWHKSARE